MSNEKAAGWRRHFTMRTLILLLVLIGVAGAGAVMLKPYWYMKGNFMPWFDTETFEGHQERLEADRSQRKVASGGTARPFDPAAPAFPGFRGARRDGAADGAGLMPTWPEGGPPVLYRQPVGSGYAGFVIGGGRAYTIEQRRREEVIACYDFETGAELWTVSYRGFFVEQMGGEGPRATPTLDGDRLYSLGASGDLYCVNAETGIVVWQRDILKGMSNLQWAMSGSPLVLGDRVYVTNSGLGGDSILALDKMTGDVIWTSLPEQQGYSSLLVAELCGKQQLLNFAAFAINGIDPDTGERLWSFPWTGSQNGINVAQPIPVGDDRVFISTGYGKGCALLQIARNGDAFSVTELWANINMKNKFNSSVLHNGYIYGLDEGVLACVKVEDGSKAWKAGRYGHGQILLAGDQILVLGEDGSLTMVAADPAGHRVLGSCHPIEGKTWNNLALAGGRLLIRNNREMACLDLRVQSPS